VEIEPTNTNCAFLGRYQTVPSRRKLYLSIDYLYVCHMYYQCLVTNRPGSESIQVDSSRLDDPESSRFYSSQLLVLLTTVDFVSSRLENDLMYYRYFLCSLQYWVVSPKRNNNFISERYAWSSHRQASIFGPGTAPIIFYLLLFFFFLLDWLSSKKPPSFPAA